MVVVVVVVEVDNSTRAEPVVVSQPLVGSTLLTTTQQQAVMVCHQVAVTNTPEWLSPRPHVPTYTHGGESSDAQEGVYYYHWAFWKRGEISPLLFGSPR